MARITVEDCLTKIDNHYDLVLLAKERTSQLNAGAEMLVPEENDKKTIISLREISEGKVQVDDLAKSAILRLRKEPDENLKQEEVEEEEPFQLGLAFRADGGRVGKAIGGMMTEDVNMMTKTPQGMSDVNVQETVTENDGTDASIDAQYGQGASEEAMAESTNEINVSYEQLRDRLPPEVGDDIVLLLSQSYEALADFAEIQTQADVNQFNTKYDVQLFLPQQSEV